MRNRSDFAKSFSTPRFSCCGPMCPSFTVKSYLKLLINTWSFFVTLRTVGLIILCYSISIGITFYQKWFIKNFHFPLTVVICHLVVKFLLSAVLRTIIELYSGKQRVVLSWPVYWKQLAPTGIASALDIGFSNWSFEFITISLYTMTKSTCIVFILMFSLIFGLEKKRCSLVAVVLLIAVGLFMFTYQSTQFNLQGFLLVLSASFLAGFRWTLAQLVIQKKEIGLGNPIDMMYHMQPWMILGLLPLSIAFEGIPISTSEKVFRYRDVAVITRTLTCVFVGSMLAFLMELTEYLLLRYTSSLTLSITGIIKEIFTLYLAIHYNGDSMTTMNYIGLVICVLGIGTHVFLKTLHVSDEEKKLSSQEPEIWQQLLAKDDDDDDDDDIVFDSKHPH
ncbi:solute carrier family 35 member C2-like isoform X2 [Centruroides vittatus]|uniref:solute carrier family 35 member C2-like isoform X2 n=1 Tax=Centruroides vittatus TaxID=120091 RepID=UPI00350F2F89